MPSASRPGEHEPSCQLNPTWSHHNQGFLLKLAGSPLLVLGDDVGMWGAMQRQRAGTNVSMFSRPIYAQLPVTVESA